MTAKTTIINFSGRQNGNCQAISQLIASCCPTGEVQVHSFADLEPHPCGKCQYECFARDKGCPYLADGIYQLYEQITSSDLAYFVVPNHCDYPNANFFLFNERSQCYFQHKPALLERYLAVPKKFVVVSNTGRENFVQAFRYQVQEEQEPEILFLSAKAYHRVSIAGDLMTSEEARRDVVAFCGL